MESGRSKATASGNEKSLSKTWRARNGRCGAECVLLWGGHFSIITSDTPSSKKNPPECCVDSRVRQSRREGRQTYWWPGTEGAGQGTAEKGTRERRARGASMPVWCPTETEGGVWLRRDSFTTSRQSDRRLRSLMQKT